MTSISTFISKRYLKSNKGFLSLITKFSFIGILLGVATLIVVMAVMNGFRHELLTRIIGVRGHVILHSGSLPIKNYKNIVNYLNKEKNIKNAFPIIEKQAVATYKSNARGIGVQAMNVEDFLKRPLLKESLLYGDIENFHGKSIIIGKLMAQQMGVRVGENISLISPKGRFTPFGTVPKQETFKVVSLFELGMHEYDKSLVFMPLESAKKFFGFMDNEIGEIEIFANNIEDSQDITEEIRKKYIDYFVLDWKHSNSSYFQAVQMERNLMFIILTLLIVIAAFNIISGLVMLVSEKTKDIGILKTMGASRWTIMKIFIINGANIGVKGTLAGTLVGLTLALNIENIRKLVEKLTSQKVFNSEIYYLIQLPSRIETSEVISIISMSLFLSLLATIYPSWKASNMNPVDALSH